MAGRPIVVQWKESAQELLANAVAESNPHLARRWQGLLLISRNWSIAETAEVIGVSYRTVENWLEWYRHGGSAELVRHRRGRARLNPANTVYHRHIEALVQHAHTHGFDSQREAIEWLDRQYGIRLSNKEMSLIFRNHGIRRQLPEDILSRLSSRNTAQAPDVVTADNPCRMRLRWHVAPPQHLAAPVSTGG